VLITDKSGRDVEQRFGVESPGSGSGSFTGAYAIVKGLRPESEHPPGF
jgi:hypothetical protein